MGHGMFPDIKDVSVSGIQATEGAQTLGPFITNIADGMKTDIVLVADRMPPAAQSVPIPAAASIVSNGLTDAAKIYSNGWVKAGEIAGGHLSKSTYNASKVLGETIQSASVKVADFIIRGFASVGDEMKSSTDRLSKVAQNCSNTAQYVFDETVVTTTNEVLMTVISLVCLLVPMILFTTLVVRVPKKQARASFVFLSVLGIWFCGVSTFGMYLRYVFYHVFSINHILLCFYMAFYAFFFGLYLVYVFIMEIKLVKSLTQKFLNWFFCGYCLLKRCWRLDDNWKRLDGKGGYKKLQTEDDIIEHENQQETPKSDEEKPGKKKKNDYEQISDEGIFF